MTLYLDSSVYPHSRSSFSSYLFIIQFIDLLIHLHFITSYAFIRVLSNLAYRDGFDSPHIAPSMVWTACIVTIHSNGSGVQQWLNDLSCGRGIQPGTPTDAKANNKESSMYPSAF